MGVDRAQAVAPGAQAAGHALLRTDDVFKIYRAAGEESVALRGASFELMPGEFVALLGRSGSGKSTLMHLIAGLDVPSAGRVFVGGVDISRLDETERARIRQDTIGIVLQRDNLIPYLTAFENVALPLQLAGRSDAKQRATEVLERVGLAHRMDHRAGQLSGGEQQRVGIAVALAPSPLILMGDEVTGELDSESVAGILELLTELQRRDHLALLLVTHDPAVAERAQRVLHVRDGVISSHG